MNEDILDAKDGRKRGEDSLLGGRRVAATGPALGLGMGAAASGRGCNGIAAGLPRGPARGTAQHAGEQALAARRARMDSGREQVRSLGYFLLVFDSI